jgi:hypothetical protein
MRTFSLNSLQVPFATSPALEALRDNNAMMDTFAYICGVPSGHRPSLTYCSAPDHSQAEQAYDTFINDILSVSPSS